MSRVKGQHILFVWTVIISVSVVDDEINDLGLHKLSNTGTYGSECWAVKKKDESKLNSAEMRMLRWARGKTRLDHIRNEDIRKEAHVKPVETFLENKRLKWFGHCLRREPNHICAKSLRLEVSGRRSRGRPRKRWRDNIQGDMKKYRLTEDVAQDRKYWMTQILAGPAQGDGQER